MDLGASLKIEAKLPQNHSVIWKGLNIVVQWPKGTMREGKDKDGKTWRREMKADYGYIDDTSAKGDRENLDIYIGDDRRSDGVFVIEQLKEDGKTFDEYKLVAGVPNLESAQALYLAHYPKGWEDDRLGDVYETSMDNLKGAVEEHKEGSMGQKVTSAYPRESEAVLAGMEGIDKAKPGTELTGFCGGGPATCMNCLHRTPHSKDASGEEMDSCNHPLVKRDSGIETDRKLPDGTVRVDADDWCELFRAPEKEEEESEGQPEGGKEKGQRPACRKHKAEAGGLAHLLGSIGYDEPKISFSRRPERQ